jgi:hypothetical protein
MILYYPEIVFRGIQTGKHFPYSFLKIPDPSPEGLPPVPAPDGAEIPSTESRVPSYPNVSILKKDWFVNA